MYTMIALARNFPLIDQRHDGIKSSLYASWAVEQIQQTRRPLDQCLQLSAWKASRCDLRGPKFEFFFALRADNQVLSVCL